MILNSKEYELSDQLKKSLDISKTIYLQLMKGECKYEVKSKVSEDVFKAFVEYLIEGTDIEIHFDTIYELKQLGKEFAISDLLEKLMLRTTTTFIIIIRSNQSKNKSFRKMQ